MIIKLEIKPLSYNQYYKNSRTGKRIKTGAGLAYDEELGLLLGYHASALKKFGREIDLSKDIVKLEIFNYKTNFFRKDGELSKTAGDWDNPVKVLQDKIFKTMEVDDYIVKIGKVVDIPSSDLNGVIIDLNILDIPEMQSFKELHDVQIRSSEIRI